MDLESLTTVPFTETATTFATDTEMDPIQRQALDRQKVIILGADIATFRQLHATYSESPTDSQLGLLARRATGLLARMDELAGCLLLHPEELNQFIENKRFLDELAFQFAGECLKKREEVGGLGHFAGYGFFGRRHRHHGHWRGGHGGGRGHHGHGHKDKEEKMEKKWHKHAHKWMKKQAKHLPFECL